MSYFHPGVFDRATRGVESTELLSIIEVTLYLLILRSDKGTIKPSRAVFAKRRTMLREILQLQPTQFPGRSAK